MKNPTGSLKPWWLGARIALILLLCIIAVAQVVSPADAQDIVTPTLGAETPIPTVTPTVPTGSAELTSTPTLMPDLSAQPGSNGVTAAPQASTSMVQIDQTQAVFVDEQNGYVYLASKLYWTSNGGNTWKEITPADFGSPNSASIQFVDRNLGAVLADDTQEDGVPVFVLYKTADGGASWVSEKANLPYPEGDLLSFESSSTFFLDVNTGWISLKIATGSNFSRGMLFRTDDGGATWTFQQVPIGGSVYFASSQVGWVAGGPAGNELYRTQDGGSTWQTVELPELPSQGTISIQLPHLFDDSNGFLPVIAVDQTSAQTLVYKTSDGGVTWSLSTTIDLQSANEGVAISYTDKQLKKISVANDQTIVSSDGKVNTAVKTDHGMPGSPKKLYLFNAQAGFSELEQSTCTANNPGGNGKIHCTKEYQLLRTNDGGKNWSPLTLPSVDATSLVAAQDFSVQTSALPTDLTATSLNSQAMLGQGFDKCEVATYSQFQAWMTSSPYRASNLYLGGISRACANVALNSSLVHSTGLMGWKFIPTWVGPQAPCSGLKNPISKDVNQAYAQGVDNAQEAVETLYTLGLASASKTGSVVYYDMEYYNPNNDPTCAPAVRSFMNGWSATIKASGNVPGVYATTSYAQLDNIIAAANPPLVIWPARYYSSTTYKQDASVWDIPELDNSIYTNHQRIRQYNSGHNETWGNTTMTIDSNVIDGVVAIPLVNQPSDCPPTTDSQNYVCKPTLNPTYSDVCSSGWYPILGFNSFTSYLAENVVYPAQATNIALWKPSLQVEGFYHVEAFIASHGSASVTCSSGVKTYTKDSSAANYVIADKDEVKTVVTVDQLPINNDWVDLGSYNFSKSGTGNYVVLNNSTYEPLADPTQTRVPYAVNISVGAVRFVATDPEITSINPLSTYAGAPGFILTVSGNYFVPGSVVRWNGVPRTTTYNDSHTLTAQIDAADVTAFGTSKLTVHNPNEGNYESIPVNFTVTSFADVGVGNWYWRYVEGFYAKGITNGCDLNPTRFCPDRAVTRAEMAVFILRSMHGLTTPNPVNTNIFADVPVAGKEWMQPWIEGFYAEGLTVGCNIDPFRFCPERNVTRAEMAVFVLRAIKGVGYQPPAVTVSSFSDVPVAGKEWMMPWIEEFYKENFTTGCTQTPTLQYCPEQSVSRAEMATFIDRAFNFPLLP